MTSSKPGVETEFTEQLRVALPPEVRDRLDAGPGDRLRWTVDDEELRVEVVEREYGVFEDVEPVDMGETNAAADHDSVGLDGKLPD